MTANKTPDLTKEQRDLWKMEKHVAGLAAATAALSGAAQAADAKAPGLGAEAALDGLRPLLLELAEKTAAVHAQLEAAAVDYHSVLMASGGDEKRRLNEVVQSLLGAS